MWSKNIRFSWFKWTAVLTFNYCIYCGFGTVYGWIVEEAQRYVQLARPVIYKNRTISQAGSRWCRHSVASRIRTRSVAATWRTCWSPAGTRRRRAYHRPGGRWGPGHCAGRRRGCSCADARLDDSSLGEPAAAARRRLRQLLRSASVRNNHRHHHLHLSSRDNINDNNNKQICIAP